MFVKLGLKMTKEYCKRAMDAVGCRDAVDGMGAEDSSGVYCFPSRVTNTRWKAYTSKTPPHMAITWYFQCFQLKSLLKKRCHQSPKIWLNIPPLLARCLPGTT